MLKFLSVLALAAMSHVSLANVIYSYTGSTYASANGVFTTSQNISGQFQTAAVLADRTSFYTISDFTSFSFSNGQTTFTDSPSSPYALANIAVKIAGGVVNQWNITFFDNVFPGNDSANPPRNVLETTGNLATTQGNDLALVCPPPASNNGQCSSRALTTVRGTWLISQSAPAPAPATLALLAGGLLATRLIGARRSRV